MVVLRRWSEFSLGHVVKHATMTTPYGVTRGTIYKQLLETEHVKSCINPPECARYLAKVLEESIPEVAIEAGKIMTWLQNAAYLLAKANRPVAWTAPTGAQPFHLYSYAQAWLLAESGGNPVWQDGAHVPEADPGQIQSGTQTENPAGDY